jgi:hypothetical protein
MRTLFLVSVIAICPLAACTDSKGSHVNGPSGGKGDGFGVDLIFDNLIATPQLIAEAACPDFGLAAGDRLDIVAEEDRFLIERSDNTPVINIAVPSQGDYVWQGQSPDRTTDEIDSPALDIRATMDDGTGDITVGKLSVSGQGCLLARCPAFGPCQ